MLFKNYKGAEAMVDIDVEKEAFTIEGGGKKDVVEFKLNPFDKELVKAGAGWIMLIVDIKS